ncbi:MAG: hypothetical protein IPH85_13960 [Ignavibacteria bacterium]|nr:hypothetical protein [Ignavibacteria bacterium]
MNTQQQSPLQQQGEYLWSSEYVSAGHPDKLADQLSDAVLDHYLALDPDARVACETMVKGDTVLWRRDHVHSPCIGRRVTLTPAGYDLRCGLQFQQRALQWQYVLHSLQHFATGTRDQ